MKKLVGFWVLLLSVCTSSIAQVDTSYVYNTTTPYGTLDIRLAKSATDYFYLQENVTFSFRESSPGVKTNTYLDMTSYDTSPYSQGNLREKVKTKDNFIMNYRLLFPLSYSQSYSSGYPLLVMMHGLGERANCWGTSCFWATSKWNPVTNSPVAPTDPSSQLLSNDNSLIHAGSPELAARNLAAGKLPNDPTMPSRAFPGFVLHAQNLNGWDVASVQNELRLIRLIIKKYNIDPNRVYIHGLSDGGAGVYEALKRAPWLFAAALPMSAISDASINSKGLAPKVANIPIWTFQGGQDTGPTPGKTELYVKQFREAGVSVRYTLYPNLGHGTWNTAYAEPDFFTWILSKNKANITIFYNNPAICGTTGQGVKLGFAFGFLAYQWEKDGVIIDGANAAEYIAMEPGVYRARFSRKSTSPSSESDWNTWSAPATVTLSTPAQAAITVTGTTAMRGPDNSSVYNTVKLKSVNVDDHYYWYKNGVLINIPSNTVDDTVRLYTITTSSAAGSGAFTLSTKGFDNCPSPTSDPINLYFGNSAPFMTDNNIPTNFLSTGKSETTVDLAWTDNSADEAGYEIWRRKPGGIFNFAGRTGANATTFHDSGLEPSVSYDYKVRAINATSRSKYAPSDSKTINLIVTTDADFTPPTTPTNLHVVSNTDHSISLAWTASTDNTGIRQYMVYFGTDSIATGSNASTYVLSGLPLNAGYYIKIKAVDLGGLESGISNQVAGFTYVSGLTYGHSTGAWTDLDQITNWNTPEFTGHVSNFTLAPRTQEDFFYFNYDGYLYITNPGTYQFRTTSDDGSRLTLNNVVIVDNDGLHGNVTVTSANQTLATGPYPINVKFFEYTGGQSLTVQWKGPDSGNNWVNIPDAALKSGTAPAVPPARVSTIVVAETVAKAETALSEEAFSLYPNPSSSDNINIRIAEGLTSGQANVRVIDMMGRPVYNNAFDQQQLKDGVRITPNETLINGMYIVHVHQGTNVIKKKLMIKN